MKKYQCIECCMRCRLQIDDYDLKPFLCICKEKFNTDWREINVKAIEISSPAKVELPDWVQECAIGYDNRQRRYFEVTNVGDVWVDIEYLDDGIGATCNHTDIQNCSEAQKRRFNAKEMKALVGKVIECVNCVQFITAYYKEENKVYVDNGWRDAEYLLINDFTVDGKHCCKFEHLNDIGEWVE